MWGLLALALVATASAQIPSLGWCPDFQPMANFNMNRFLGSWYEAERYFTVTELGTRCVTTNYERTPEGRILVSNEITNSLTGVKRVLDGSLQLIGREGEGRVIVKYSSLPVPYDTEFSILDTDYDNFAVMWSCSGIGPVHTQNAWVLTRDRLATTAVMQAAYGVLDKYKISRTFFVKTNQADCNVLPSPVDKLHIGKNAGVVENIAGKNAGAIPEVVPKVEIPLEQKVLPELKPELKLEKLVQERVALPEKPMEPAKAPMKVPELIMAEVVDKKDEKFEKFEKFEKIEKPFEEPMKSELKPEIAEKNEKDKEKEEKPKM